MNKTEEVLQCIEKETNFQIEHDNIIGITTNELSEKLMMDRANLSRILNKLNQEGVVVKKQTRPVLYLAKTPFNKINSKIFIPNIIPKEEKISDYLNNGDVNHKNNNANDAFTKFIANNPNSSMYQAVLEAKAAVMYPEKPLNIFVYGKKRTGKIDFARAIYDFGLDHKIFEEKKKCHIIDCSAFNAQNPNDFYALLFGNYTQDRIKYGVLSSPNSCLCIFYNLEKLPYSVLNRLCNSIEEKICSPIGNSNRLLTINCTVIGISNNYKTYQNIDNQLCFPISIYIPSLSERTIHEILIITMQAFQFEANNIKKTIRVSKNILSCFIMSDYKSNIQQLYKEIRQACAYANYRNFEKKPIFIDIDYDDISDYVLNNIFNVNDRMNELSNILNLFEDDFFYFSPVVKNNELEYLLNLSNLNKTAYKPDTETNSANDFVMSCLEDIKNAANIKLNMIRSVQIRDIYNLLYPILNQSPVKNNDNLQYGLLFHIEKAISKCKSSSLNYIDTMSIKIAKKDDYIFANKISNIVNENYNITLPEIEIDYIATYLYLSSQRVNDNYIQMIIVSQNSAISKDYADYINSRSKKLTVPWYNFKQDSITENEINDLISIIDKIDKNQGVIIIEEEINLNSWKDQIKQRCKAKTLFLHEPTIIDILSIVEQIESFEFKLEHFNLPFANKHITKDISTEKSASKEFLNKLINNLLSDSLNFLNPYKAGDLLYNILKNIIYELNIQYNDNLLVKFLFHGSFCIERCIKNEPFTYKKARNIINNNEKIYYVIAKNMDIANEVFNINIPDSELAMLIEIFTPYID
ncbi:MAG: PRD domain-containing protein [Catenisphaera adipataccumulans]|jgi:transcriptional regulator with AAA-type ATPase domain/transcriptional regulatory protein LevR|uniref:PRD domain-containing protein n=1 Tax=Catenisphaera adipataccumulans TaxID=700500 RepID=UPI003D9242C0